MAITNTWYVPTVKSSLCGHQGDMLLRPLLSWCLYEAGSQKKKTDTSLMTKAVKEEERKEQ